MDRACWSGQWVSKVSWSVSQGRGWKRGSVEGGRDGWMEESMALGFLNSFTFASSPSLSLSLSLSPSSSLSLSLALVLDFDFDFVRKASAAYTFLLAGWVRGTYGIVYCIVAYSARAPRYLRYII